MQAGQMIPPLMTKRSFVDKSDLGGHHGCKQKPLPEFYWRMSRRVPQNFPCFAMTLFDKACQKMRQNEARLIQDFTRLIIPFAENAIFIFLPFFATNQPVAFRVSMAFRNSHLLCWSFLKPCYNSMLEYGRVRCGVYAGVYSTLMLECG